MFVQLPQPLAINLRYGLCFAGALFFWQLGSALKRLLSAVAQFGRFNTDNVASTVVGFELRVLFACLAAGLGVALASAGFSAFLLRVLPRRPFLRPWWVCLGAFLLLICLIIGREMALHPALFETAYLKPDGSHGLLSLVANHLGVRPFQVLLWVYGLVAIPIPALAIGKALCALSRKFRRVLISGAVVLILVMGLQFWTGLAKKTGPNVLLLVGDSLRPDHFSGHGYPRDTTPNIDALMRRGTTFTNLYVSLARTIPSWTSMLTGVYATGHGITTMFPAADARKIVLPTVPKILDAKGIHTAIVADYAGDFFSMVDYGFQEKKVPPAMTQAFIAQREMLIATPLLLPFLNHTIGWALFPVLRFLPKHADPDVLTDELLATLDTARQSDKFFVAAFYSVTHIPYAAPAPDFARYAVPGYRGENRYSFSLRGLSDLAQWDRDLPPAELEQAIALYDGALHAFDRRVGRVLTYLDETGLAQNTTVILLGDHGEVLRGGKHGMQHGNTLTYWDDLLIPCVVRHPKAGEGKRIAALHSNVDIAPTLLSLFNLAPASSMHGTSLWENGQPSLWGASQVFFETGEWRLAQPRRLPNATHYPVLADLIESDREGHWAIRPHYREFVELAKHRAVFDGNWLLLYQPDAVNDKLVLVPRSRSAYRVTALAELDRVKARLASELSSHIASLPGAHFDPGRAMVDMSFEQE